MYVVKRQKILEMTESYIEHVTVLNNQAIYSCDKATHFLAHVVNSWLIYDNKMLWVDCKNGASLKPFEPIFVNCRFIEDATWR